MASRRAGLGRGLESLIPGADEGGAGVAWADIDALEANPLQPRTQWDEEALESLSASIREHGVIQPILVTRNGLAKPYQIIAGERRWRAAQRAGLSSVPILVREATPAQILEIALVENIQRSDLNPIEEAVAYRHLSDEFGLTQAQIATRVGRSRPAIANALRLLQAPEPLRAAVARGEITAGHAKALLAIDDTDQMLRALTRVVDGRLSVRQTEQLAQARTAAMSPPQRARKPLSLGKHDRALTDQLSRALGTKVELARTERGGRLVIHFYSDEDLTAVANRILGEDDEY